ncbi:MAG: VWA domain-containing protein [Acidobacteria bacterium]|nr:VWA domain-containing protein [Acidobacteriota bacterium]
MIALAAAVALSVVEEVEVRRVPWPVVVEALPFVAGSGNEARCRALSPSDVEVSEDGTAARVVAIDQGEVPVLYAVVVDTSGSMSAFLPEIGDALAEFAGALAPHEQALLASLDDDFVLLAPPGAGRDELAAAARRLRYGTNTLLRESLHDLLLGLESRPGRKVLFLVTDGGDSQAVKQVGWERVTDAAAAIPDLSLFVVGISHPREWQHTLPLREIASASGGVFHEIGHGGDVRPALARLHERIAAEATLVYEPPPAGARTAALGNRVRVRVRARPGVPCRLTPARTSRALFSVGARDVARHAVRWEIGGDGAPECAAALGPGRWLGFSAVENLAESGPLYDAGPWRSQRRLSARERLTPRTGLRSLGLFVMPSLRVLEAPAAADEIVWTLVAGGGIDCLVQPGGVGFGPLVAHGRTLLEARPELARRTAEGDDAWDRFAIAVQPAAASPDDARTEGLADWLGDIPARELLLALQARGATELLAGRTAGADRLETAWPRLVDAFGAATAAGVVALLVPALGPERESIGYWRVVLPRPPFAGPPPAIAPRAPLALSAARWIAGQPDLRRVRPPEWLVAEVGQAEDHSAAWLSLEAPQAAGRLVIEVRFAKGKPSTPLSAVAHAEPAMAPHTAEAARAVNESLGKAASNRGQRP